MAETTKTEIVDSTYDRARLRRLLQLEGASAYANNLGRAIASHAVIMAREIRDEKLYLLAEEEFETFREYLDKRKRPMTYHEFNARDKLLDDLGIEEFDLLSGMGLSLAKQERLIGRFRLDGNEYVVKHADGTEERVSKTDPVALNRLLPAVIADITNLERTDEEKDNRIERGTQQLEQVKRKLDEALRAHGIAVPETDEDFTDFLVMMEFARRARGKVANFDPEKKRALKKIIFDSLSQLQMDFGEVYELASSEEAKLAASLAEDTDELN